MKYLAAAFSLINVQPLTKLIAIAIADQCHYGISSIAVAKVSQWTGVPEADVIVEVAKLNDLGFFRRYRVANSTIYFQYSGTDEFEDAQGSDICGLTGYEFRTVTGKSNIPAELRDRLIATYPRCLRCGSTQSLSIDHVVPECFGGPTEFENLQVLCRSCNNKKGMKFVDYRRPENDG